MLWISKIKAGTPLQINSTNSTLTKYLLLSALKKHIKTLF